MLAWYLEDKTANIEPSSVIEAERGLLVVLSSLRTVIMSSVASRTYILDELSARRVRPLGENEKRNASAPGKAAEELALTEMRLMRVRRGRR